MSATPVQVPLRAFFGDPAIKAKYVARLRAHQLADQFVQRSYTNGEDPDSSAFRGCAVGCTLHSNDHLGYETELGIPFEIAILHDICFEGLPEAEAPQFAVDFLDAIPVGADLSKVFDQFILWLLGELMALVEDGQLKALFDEAIALYQRRINGEDVDLRAFEDLRKRALDLARYLARALDLARALALDLDLDRALDLARALALARARALDLALDLARALALDRARALDRALDLALARARDLARDLADQWRLNTRKVIELLEATPVIQEGAF